LLRYKGATSINYLFKQLKSAFVPEFFLPLQNFIAFRTLTDESAGFDYDGILIGFIARAIMISPD
jgi:hypothetical protein